ncbi:hypothetical protein [Alteribacillus sp. YIM 98480]|uniref:hypothetical protein n=1 Tax=Alteribacillus sp. YIM 98480 TaxID=2606599 RepID=UPI00131D8A7E|nr:hypothetical protein [Alteribacillus sp. YIM 98480]
MKFICDICHFDKFLPLSEVSVMEIGGSYQLSKMRSTGTTWKCGRCGEIYGPEVNMKEQKVIRNA